MVKNIFKRLMLMKWVCAIYWRVVVQKRTMYALSDVPLTVLRWYAIYSEHHLDLDDEQSRDFITWNAVFSAVCDELEIREQRIRIRRNRD